MTRGASLVAAAAAVTAGVALFRIAARSSRMRSASGRIRFPRLPRAVRHVLAGLVPPALIALVPSLSLSLLRPRPQLFVLSMLAILSTAAAFLYVLSSSARLSRLTRAVRTLRLPLIVILPAAAFWIALGSPEGPEIPLPRFRTVVHSTPPLEFVGLENPWSGADPLELPVTSEALTYGKTLFENNCAFCHGLHADGKGPESDGFNPPPADFHDPGTIAQLKQSYLVWRLTVGGWDAPFFSAMPRWGLDIDESEMWRIVLYDYRAANVHPRRAER